MKSLRTGSKTALVSAVVSVGVGSPAFAALYTSGHGDIGVGYEDEETPGTFELHPHWHLGSTAVVDGAPVGNAPDGEEFDAGDITAAVTTANTAPNNATFNDGTGVAAGATIWTLPQGSTPGVPFLGIATEELTPADWVGSITFELGAVTSPSGSGHFSLWQSDGLGGLSFFWSTNNELGTVNGDNTLLMAAGGHDHFNYGFSEQGTWDVEITVSGEHVDDGVVSTTETFSFSVVPEPTSALLCGLGALGFLARRRRA